MSVFGSREEDPLLQDDPLAPSSEKEASDETAEEPSSGKDAAEEAPSNGDVSPPGSTARGSSEEGSPVEESTDEEGVSFISESEGTDSVFHAGPSDEKDAEDGHFHFEGSEETRVIVRSAQEAGEGRLTVLNAALDEGWRLDRLELRKDVPAEGDSGGSEISSQEAMALAFILCRPEAE